MQIVPVKRKKENEGIWISKKERARIDEGRLSEKKKKVSGYRNLRRKSWELADIK